MQGFKFRGWAKAPVEFYIRAKDREAAEARAQLGDYDSYTPTADAPLDLLIDPTSSRQDR